MDTEKIMTVVVQAMNEPAFRDTLRTDFLGELNRQGIHDQEEIRLLDVLLTRIIAYDPHVSQIKDLQESVAKLQFSPLTSQKYRDQLEHFAVNQLRSTELTSDSFKNGLINSLDQIKRGFNTAMVMYTVAFYVGILLILAALVFAWFKGESLLPVAFAGLGVADLIAYFITKPPLDLQKSRANLAQLQTAYYNWFIDLFNWNSIINSGEEMIHLYKKVSDMMMRNTERTMKMIEDYCEIASSDNAAAKNPGLNPKNQEPVESGQAG